MIDSKIISRFKKEKFIREKPEKDFRDTVVRPLFLRTGLKDGRDLCGIDEEGKDCFFIGIDQLEQRLLYVVQTKKGNVNLTAEASKSLITAITQLRTSLATQVCLPCSKEKMYPSFAVLCASGKINGKARKHICDEIKDTRLKFYDIDELIPLIDTHYSELWLGIDAEKVPYFNKLKELISRIANTLLPPELIVGDSKLSAATDQTYIPLRLNFITYQIKKNRGQVNRIPKIKEIPIEAILRKKGSFFLILGEAGTGKSTALKRIAYTLCDQILSEEKPLIIPVLLRAIDIAERNIGLIDICSEATQHVLSSKTTSFSAEDLENGNVLVLVDALDEVANQNDSRKVLNAIENFIEDYPNCRIILTSRDYTYLRELQELSKYETYRLTTINLSQAKKMVEKLVKGKVLPKEDVQEIVRRLQDVHGIDITPLLVTVFVATSDYTRKDIPANITELFKKYTEMMLGRWDISKGLSQQYQAPLKDFLLQRLAYQMHTGKIISISINECINIFKHELEIRGKTIEDINSLIKEILYRSGLFRIFEHRIEFRHLLLQEFFAGRGIPSPAIIPTLIKDQWWQRAIIFYFGENPGDNKSLELTAQTVATINPQERFQSAVTVGLSTQACYLVEMVKKIELLKWVLERLSASKTELLPQDLRKTQEHPLTKFVLYYLFGRDAVAVDVLETEGNVSRIIQELHSKEKSEEEKEAIVFWVMVGLIERGDLEKAERMIESFDPRDVRLLLALHLGCFFVENLRISTKDQRDTAKRICNKISPRIGRLRSQLLDELTSELLEIRRDKVNNHHPRVVACQCGSFVSLAKSSNCSVWCW